MKYFIAIFCLLFLSCSNSNNLEKKINDSEKKIIVQKFPNGKIKSEREYIERNDSIIYEGLSKLYYLNGTTGSTTLYKNNVPNGQSIIYDSTGIMMYRNYYSFGTVFGMQYSYYNSGQIKSIVCYFLGNKRQFEADYKLNGNISFKGIVVYATTFLDTSYKVGKTIHMNSFIAVLPHTKTLLHTILAQDNNYIIDSTFANFKLANNYYMKSQSFKVMQPGIYRYTSIAWITDSSTNIILKKDTSQRILSVTN